MLSPVTEDSQTIRTVSPGCGVTVSDSPAVHSSPMPWAVQSTATVPVAEPMTVSRSVATELPLWCSTTRSPPVSVSAKLTCGPISCSPS